MANVNFKTVVGALLLSSAITLVGCGGGEERQATYLERAKEYFDEGNIDKARIEVKNVLQINPNNAEARYYLGLISEKDQDFRGAFGNFNAAVEQDPKHIKALNKLAEYYAGSKEFEKARENADAVIAIDPKNADALATLAVIYASQEDRDKAILKAQEAIAVDPGNVKAVAVLTAIYAQDNPELALETITQGIANQSQNESLKVVKLRLLASQGKRNEVVQLYKELIAEYPDKIIYPVQLVNYYLADENASEDERKDLAEQTLRELVKSQSDNEQPKLLLAEFLIKNRSAAEAKQTLIEFVNAAPESQKLTDALAALYVREGEIEAAKKLYQVAIDENPTSTRSIEARNRLVTLALQQEDRETADRLQKEIFDLEPENTTALLTSARLKLSENKVNDAIPDLRVVLKNDPESKSALLLLAQAHERNKAPDLALDNYQRLLTLQADSMPALVGAARILINKNESEQALPLLENAVKVDAANPEAVKLLADIYSREQRWDDALSASAKLIESGTETTKALGYYLQGRIYLRKQDYDEALKALKNSIEIEPNGIETLSSIAAAYIAQEQTDKALDYVKAYLSKYPNQVHAQELEAGLYARQHNNAKATEIAEAIIKKNPDRYSTYAMLSRIYLAEGKVDQVERLYQDGIRNNPEAPIYRISLAEVYQSKGQFDQAIKQYEESVKIAPDALVAKNNLASLLLDRDDKPETIQRAAELSVDLAATENPAFLDTAGWVQYKLGNYAQAVSLLAAAVDNGGKGAIFHYHLGMAYFKSDMSAQAKEHLIQAVKDETANYAGREEAERVLKTL